MKAIRKTLKLPFKTLVALIEASGRALLRVSEFLHEMKLRLLIRINSKKHASDSQVLDIYWDDGFAAAAEHWGEATVWEELKYFMANCQGRVLDIACGSGRTIEILHQFERCEFYGCDISDVLISIAIRRHPMSSNRFTVCDARSLPYESDWFNYAYTVGSLEHFTVDGIQGVLKECHRAVKYASFHHVPVSKRGRDEGWIVTDQGYHLNSLEWWISQCDKVYDNVYALKSSWKDSLSVGVWLVCTKRESMEHRGFHEQA